MRKRKRSLRFLESEGGPVVLSLGAQETAASTLGLHRSPARPGGCCSRHPRRSRPTRLPFPNASGALTLLSHHRPSQDGDLKRSWSFRGPDLEPEGPDGCPPGDGQLRVTEAVLLVTALLQLEPCKRGFLNSSQPAKTEVHTAAHSTQLHKLAMCKKLKRQGRGTVRSVSRILFGSALTHGGTSVAHA